ncbi:MAG TPA: AMP-binding protein, partial [Kiloniellales bacterium]|nr:AMP-binding protein [Kiloniellales bacterium]
MRHPAPSYVHGTSTQALLGDTIGRAFDAACAAHAGRDALVACHQSIRWSYAELKQRVDALACGLMRLGLVAGDRIG